MARQGPRSGLLAHSLGKTESVEAGVPGAALRQRHLEDLDLER
jgi:hypothetical protein